MSRSEVLFLLLLLVVATACGDASEKGRQRGDAVCDTATVRPTVTTFGERLKQVPLLAPESTRVAAIRAHYQTLVTDSVLNAWIRDSGTAPGRDVSSPWPDRIEIQAMDPESNACSVTAEVVYATSTGDTPTRVPLRLVVQDGRINDYRSGGTADEERSLSRPNTLPSSPPADETPGSVPDGGATEPDAADAVGVIRAYYNAIGGREYARAYRMWENEGSASGQSADAFAEGFLATASVTVDVGAPGRVEPAAGSRYVEIPVTVRARTTDGRSQRFEGAYTLRRSVVDGATPAQRRWQIYRANLSPAD